MEVEVKERPILFSGPMVRAILEGKKTQTRRVIKPLRGYEYYNIISPNRAADPAQVWMHSGVEQVGVLVDCPYGKPGDRLWVRETHAFVSCEEEAEDEYSRWTEVLYKADYDKPVTDLEEGWRPSIHMPMWATRIMLEITNIKVERVQDISLEDIKAEGVKLPPGMDVPELQNHYSQWEFEWFNLWDRINGEGSYKSNPWVWVVEFKKIG